MVDRVDGAELSPGVSQATAAHHTREVDPLAVTKRLQRDGRWPDAEPVKNQLIREARQKGMARSEAQSWAYSEIDRQYPPLTGSSAPATESQSVPEDPGATGLGDLPADWPQLPANASLQVEIAWVSANRLRVRHGFGVDLSRALCPAPSYSALSWLETSILFPAKFADISVKATATQDDEREFIKREKLAIEEIRRSSAKCLMPRTEEVLPNVWNNSPSRGVSKSIPIPVPMLRGPSAWCVVGQRGL